MTNLAEWAQINPFQLNSVSLGGSGYDVAVAHSKSAVLFQNQPEIHFQKVNFNPKFKNELIFIHLNQKQNSREGIQLYRSKEKNAALIEELTLLTKQIFEAEKLEEFSDLMTLHEKKLSLFLGIETVKENISKTVRFLSKVWARGAVIL